MTFAYESLLEILFQLFHCSSIQKCDVVFGIVALTFEGHQLSA